MIKALPAILQTRRLLRPAGHWRFDDAAGTTVKDSSGNGNIGTASAGVTWVTGNKGGAATFATAYVQIANNPRVNVLGDFTVAAWVKSTQAPVASEYPMLVSKVGGAPDVGFQMVLHSSTSAPWYASIWTNGTEAAVNATSDAADGAWHHLLAVRAGTTLRVYHDGVQQGTSTVSAVSLLNPAALFLGALNTTPTYPYAGDLDDVRFYNRALSQSEITALAKA